MVRVLDALRFFHRSIAVEERVLHVMHPRQRIGEGSAHLRGVDPVGDEGRIVWPNVSSTVGLLPAERRSQRRIISCDSQR